MFFARNRLAFSFFSVLPDFFVYPSIVCLAKNDNRDDDIIIIKDRYGNPCAFLINCMVAGRMSNYAWGCKNMQKHEVATS